MSRGPLRRIIAEIMQPYTRGVDPPPSLEKPPTAVGYRYFHDSKLHPPSARAELWRYLTFTKFAAMLASSSLYFCRIDRLGEKFEGSIPRRQAAVLRKRLSRRPRKDGRPTDQEYLSKQENYLREARAHVAASCWHLSRGESALLWRTYCGTEPGVAIRTTYSALCRSFVTPDPLPRDGITVFRVFIGRVTYTDFESGTVPVTDDIRTFLHKRREFWHENEVRALISDPGGEDRRGGFLEGGRNIPVDLGTLIHSLHLAPDSPKWFASLVGEMCVKFSLGIEPTPSSLSIEPTYFYDGRGWPLP